MIKLRKSQKYVFNDVQKTLHYVVTKSNKNN